jgi:hypothetical protein
MRKLLIILLFLIALGVNIPVVAQSSNHLDAVLVEILPEYDQPKVLVISRLSLVAGTTLPVTFKLRIPSQAEVWAVASVNPVDSQLQDIPYDRSANGLWATLTITVNSLNVQVEYYEPLVKNGTTRHIVYEWAGDYVVDSFTVVFQQPIGATGFITNPNLTESSVDQSGSVFYQSTPQALDAGQTYTLSADYQKATDALSTTGLVVNPAQPLDSNTPGRVTFNNILSQIKAGLMIPWVSIGIVCILIVGGIVLGYYLSKNNSIRSPKSRKHHTTMNQAPKIVDIYCSQCGKRAQLGDVFCRTCGTRLPKSE